MPKMSVIIPCYNAAQYIPNLNQLWEQTTSDFELILIDDCSTDNTWELINTFKVENADRAIIIARNESNLGPGGTRNQGMELSSGQYVMFLDCDDIYDHEMLKQMANQLDATGSDFVVCSYAINNMITHQHTSHYFRQDLINHIKIFNEAGGAKSGQLSSDTLTELLLLIVPNIWKMIRRDFLIKNKIFFPKIYYGEDGCWTKQLILNAHRIGIINKILYTYNQRRANSLTAEISERAVKGVFIQFSHEHQIFSKAGLFSEMNLRLYKYYWGTLLYHAQYINKAPEPLRTKLLQQLWQGYQNFCQTYHIPFKPQDLPIRSY